ncbi:putidacin L1 family lectin-like bacteriocin [Pseudomonas graminis]|uniref:D-mannose binding lectin n=1 Tax=Pseudomonas graminis TaxID=158627 RepID=A0A1I0JNH8_9PSED|nr:putidacin L1 family lectin-like bacteriocin [Pseudomonas graminis]SEU12117.1 D-mannose binding lectin [Pseudomonas graminis]
MTDPAPTPFTGSGSSVLPPKQSMTIGQYLVSPNGRYKLVLQSDSNLALWDTQSTAGNAIWAGNLDQPYSMNLTHEKIKTTRFYVSNSGYLEDSLRQRMWMMNTNNASDNGLWDRSHLVVQDDANIVILDIRAVYSSNRSAKLLPNTGDVTIFPPGMSLEVGRQYPAGDFFIVFQADGNLVVYTKSGGVVWHTETYGKDAKTAVMQTDGNFVIYSSTGMPLWNSQTGNVPGAYAQLQNNGAFVICAGVPIWARFGWKPGKSPKVFYPDNGGPWKTYDRVIYTF